MAALAAATEIPRIFRTHQQRCRIFGGKCQAGKEIGVVEIIFRDRLELSARPQMNGQSVS